MPCNQEGRQEKTNYKESSLMFSVLILLVGSGAIVLGSVLWFQGDKAPSTNTIIQSNDFHGSERNNETNEIDTTVPTNEIDTTVPTNEIDTTVSTNEIEKIISNKPETESITTLPPAYELPQLDARWIPQRIRRALVNKIVSGPLKELELSRIQNSRHVALTFDAHYKSDHIIRILKTLAKYNLKATFFLTGYWAERSPDYVRKIVAEGHEIGNHTFSHSMMTQLNEPEILEELRRAEEAIESAMDGHIAVQPFVRYPYGDRNSETVRILIENGYIPTYWGLDSLDSRAEATGDSVRFRILENTEPGDIILMHAGSSETANVLEEIINGFDDRKLIPCSLSALLESGSGF